MLYWVFSEDINKYELLESYLRIDQQIQVVRNLLSQLSIIDKQAHDDPFLLIDCLEIYKAFASTIYPQGTNEGAVLKLQEGLSNRTYKRTFYRRILTRFSL